MSTFTKDIYNVGRLQEHAGFAPLSHSLLNTPEHELAAFKSAGHMCPGLTLRNPS